TLRTLSSRCRSCRCSSRRCSHATGCDGHECRDRRYRHMTGVDVVALFASADFWSAVLRIATPLIFGTLGALLCERAGVLNLGIEGIMVAGALAGWLAVYQGANLWVGVLAAALAGATFGLLHAFLTVSLALSQHVSGLGITLLATSASYYAYRVTFPNVSTPPTIQPFGEMTAIPIPVLSAQTPLTWAALAAV